MKILQTAALIVGLVALLTVSALGHITIFDRLFNTSPVNVSGASELSARVATSSTILVGPQQTITVFSARETCATRIISTVGTPIMLSFDSSITPSATVGVTQAASTTVEYDNARFGCAAITAYGFSSTTITKVETAL